MTLRVQRLALIAPALLLAACASTVQPSELPTPFPEGQVRVTRTDFATILMRNGRVVGDSLVGVYGDPATPIAVAVRKIRRIEVLNDQGVATSRVGGGVPMGGFLAVIILVVLVLSMNHL